MSSYLTSSLNQVVSSIKRTVNEFINEASSIAGNVREVNPKVNKISSPESNEASYTDFIPISSRRFSNSESADLSSTSLEITGVPEPRKRLSLAKIFGDPEDVFSAQASRSEAHESPTHATIFISKEPCSPLRTQQAIKRRAIVEAVKRGPSSMPSLSTLLEEEDVEKSIEPFPQLTCSSPSGSAQGSSSKRRSEEAKTQKVDKFCPPLEDDVCKTFTDPVDAVGLLSY